MERLKSFFTEGVKKIFRIDQGSSSKKEDEVSEVPEYDEVEMIIKINDAKSFDELYKILGSVKGLRGTKGFYDSLTLIKLIEGIRIGILNHEDQKPFIKAVTNSCGLRDKVFQLLKQSLGL